MKTRAYGKLLAIAGAVTAVVAVGVSIYINPPSSVRAHALDQERLQGLQRMDLAIKAFYRTHQLLPERLDAIRNNNDLSAGSNWEDPKTHQPFEYQVVSKTAYRLCADFSADSEPDENPYFRAFRKHHKGRDCFEQDVNAPQFQ